MKSCHLLDYIRSLSVCQATHSCRSVDCRPDQGHMGYHWLSPASRHLGEKRLQLSSLVNLYVIPGVVGPGGITGGSICFSDLGPGRVSLSSCWSSPGLSRRYVRRLSSATCRDSLGLGKVSFSDLT